jgi:hypothetical protein
VEIDILLSTMFPTTKSLNQLIDSQLMTILTPAHQTSIPKFPYHSILSKENGTISISPIARLMQLKLVTSEMMKEILMKFTQVDLTQLDTQN